MVCLWMQTTPLSRSAGRCRSGDGALLPGRASACHLDSAAEVAALGDNEVRRDDIAGHSARGLDLDPLAGGHIAGNRAHDHDHLRGDRRFDVGVGADGERMTRQRVIPPSI